MDSLYNLKTLSEIESMPKACSPNTEDRPSEKENSLVDGTEES